MRCWCVLVQVSVARRHMAQSYLTYLLLSCTGYSIQSSVRTSQWLTTGTVGTCLFCSCCYVSHYVHVVSVLLIMATFVQKRALLSKLVVHLKIKYTISSKGKNMLLVWHSPINTCHLILLVFPWHAFTTLIPVWHMILDVVVFSVESFTKYPY